MGDNPYNMLLVSDIKNKPDSTTNYGKVDYEYFISKYLITIEQYCEFLNSIAKTDTNSLYVTQLETDLTVAGIKREGIDGEYIYSVVDNEGDSSKRPISYVNWFDMVRFINWLSNNKKSGLQDSTTTENGSYDLSKSENNTIRVKRNNINPNNGYQPYYYLANEDEWYKAAFYCPKLNDGEGGYYLYATQSNEPPNNIIGSGTNMANIIDERTTGYLTVPQDPYIKAGRNYLTDVGVFINNQSYYGTFDQSGNLWEQLENNEILDRRYMYVRGGAWTSFTNYTSSAIKLVVKINVKNSNGGFRIVSLFDKEVLIEMVNVRNKGNEMCKDINFGKVDYDYSIGKHEITNEQYCSFLNSIAKKDTYGLYDQNMETDKMSISIKRTGSNGHYKYSIINDNFKKPITYINYFCMLRFINWISNGQPKGLQDSTTTENGSYDLSSSRNYSIRVKRNKINPNTNRIPLYYLPTTDEWYKSAFYCPTLNDGNGGYYLYATQSNDLPGNIIGNQPNMVNYVHNGLYCVIQNSGTFPDEYYLTDVGSFTESKSYYGTYDQNGNVWEVTDDFQNDYECNLFGGAFGGSKSSISLSYLSSNLHLKCSDVGFRVSSIV